ncbi:MAG: PH domain-containing protein [Thermoplasmata archaeon]|nr:PH domain-containing protein [Thermoplasmata archaeon]
MSSSPASLGPMPKLLRSALLADQEALLRETRATKLYFFPGPILVLIVLGILDYAAASVRYGWGAFPGLTALFEKIPSGNPQGTYLLIFFLFVTLLAVIWLIVRYLRWITNVYAVTTHRVIVQSGILGRQFDEIPVGQVRGVDVHQSVLQRLLRYGTVRVSAEGGGGPRSIGNEDWEGIPHPFDFQRLIESANQGLSRANAGGNWNAGPSPPRL